MRAGRNPPIATARVDNCCLNYAYYLDGNDHQLPFSQLVQNWRINDHACMAIPSGLNQNDEHEPEFVQLRQYVQECTVVIQGWPDCDEFPWWNIGEELFCIPLGTGGEYVFPPGHHEILAVNPPNYRAAANSRTMFIRWSTPEFALMFRRCFQNLTIEFEDGNGHTLQTDLNVVASDRAFLIKNVQQHYHRAPNDGNVRQFKWVWWGLEPTYANSNFAGMSPPHANGRVRILNFRGLSNIEFERGAPEWFTRGVDGP